MEDVTSKDHDLLIQINTKLERVIYDVQELKSDTIKRVSALEEEKENKIDVRRAFTESEKISQDHETRLRGVEREQDDFKGRYAIIAALAVIILSGFVSWLVNVITGNYKTEGVQTTITTQNVPLINTTSSKQ